MKLHVLDSRTFAAAPAAGEVTTFDPALTTVQDSAGKAHPLDEKVRVSGRLVYVWLGDVGLLRDEDRLEMLEDSFEYARETILFSLIGLHELMLELPDMGFAEPAESGPLPEPDALPIMLQVNGNVTEDPVPEPAPLLGSPAQVAADLEKAAKLGVGHVFWHFDENPLRSLPLLAQLRRG